MAKRRRCSFRWEGLRRRRIDMEGLRCAWEWRGANGGCKIVNDMFVFEFGLMFLWRVEGGRRRS